MQKGDFCVGESLQYYKNKGEKYRKYCEGDIGWRVQKYKKKWAGKVWHGFCGVKGVSDQPSLADTLIVILARE